MADTPNENAGDNTASIAPLLLGVIWSLGTVALVVCVLRLYTAVLIVQRVKPEDYLMFAALLCALAQTCLLTASARWGLGRHIGTLSEEQVMHTAKFFILGEGWSVASTAFGRISFSVYLLQFVVINRMRQFLLYSFIHAFQPCFGRCSSRPGHPSRFCRSDDLLSSHQRGWG
jgi:peptidoglycan/LPS O-acetylase OafA/YrhL